jgi:5-methylcytosine-specific restriction endonuclease McrA
MRRDNFKCKNCGRSPATDQSIILHVDHINAWAKGGETILENLQTLCSVCNIGKSDLE